jgi:hypothetical protein
MIEHFPARTLSVDPAWVQSLHEEMVMLRHLKEQYQTHKVLLRSHMYPQQLRWMILNWCFNMRGLPSQHLARIHSISREWFPGEEIYWVGYCEQIFPSGPHIDVVHNSHYPELNHAHRTVMIPLANSDRWTCTFDLWAHSHSEFASALDQARVSEQRYPEQRDWWQGWHRVRWADRVRVTHRMRDRVGEAHTWSVHNVHSSSWWNPADHPDCPAREFLLWHTLAPGQPLPSLDRIRAEYPQIDERAKQQLW